MTELTVGQVLLIIIGTGTVAHWLTRLILWLDKPRKEGRR